MNDIFKRFSVILILGLSVAAASSACKTVKTDANKPETDVSAAAISGNNTNAAPAGTKKVYPDVPSPVMVSRLDGLDEKQFTLDEYKGKTVLINFWATWCSPCKQEIPELIKISDEYKGKDFVVIGLNNDEEPKASVKAFAEKMNITYQIGWANDDLSSYFRPRGIPASYLINREGKLVAAFTGFNPNTTPTKIRQVLDETLAQ